MPRALAAALALTLLGVSVPAAAQGADEGVTQLEALSLELGVTKSQLADQLQAGDCAAACNALASMQRAADKICELESGPRCEDAKRDVEAARQRVSAACPDCIEAQRDGEGANVDVRPTQPAPERLEEEREAKDLDDDHAIPMAGAAQPSDAPPAEHERGGCAACTVGESPDRGSDALGWLAVGAAVAIARRRRR